ncbi:MAG: hypothetical protein HWN68_10800 [Desulfobacterales bacterium]|nr:hypothetical protein [Desulfobacterales bacterium]
MGMDEQQINDLLQNFDIYLKSVRVKPSTLRTYIPEASRFLKSIKGKEFDESDGRAYLANLYSMKDSTANKIYYALLALFKSQNIRFEMDPPQIVDSPFQPTIRPDEMPTLITAIKESGDPNERGALALSTIYGVRRVEIWRASENDLNREDRTITIHTAKKGRVRTHLIPDEVLDHISGYDFIPRSDQTYANLFWGMIKKAGLDFPKGYGFHSIRRALYTGLTGKVDFLFRHEFLRWRIRGINLAMIYDQNPPAQIDKIVFDNHPFLGAWR